ncbi:MAG TPA: asparagine synthetase B, partial [Opitutaceae bacterium]|nr:asparagine synthetase B [Opitutaceae bacterium]
MEPTEVGQMVDMLAHWGPDATGVWAAGAIGLGHLALWTTPEAPLERAPYRLEEADIVLTADARIDNRDELRRDLDLAAHPIGSIADAELIVRSYEKWGTDCVDRLVGDFAFALWDGRKRRLFCARDPLGVRPFFYHLDQRRFLFASQIKAIFVD